MILGGPSRRRDISVENERCALDNLSILRKQLFDDCAQANSCRKGSLMHTTVPTWKWSSDLELDPCFAPMLRFCCTCLGALSRKHAMEYARLTKEYEEMARVSGKEIKK